jgi:hypothetical protein
VKCRVHAKSTSLGIVAGKLRPAGVIVMQRCMVSLCCTVGRLICMRLFSALHKVVLLLCTSATYVCAVYT